MYLCIYGFHIHRFNQTQVKNTENKIAEISKKQNLSLNFLHAEYYANSMQMRGWEGLSTRYCN
jgi:hypothetical protein